MFFYADETTYGPNNRSENAVLYTITMFNYMFCFLNVCVNFHHNLTLEWNFLCSPNNF